MHAGYPQGLILKELAEYILSDAVQKPMKWFYFAALPEKVGPHAPHGESQIFTVTIITTRSSFQVRQDLSVDEWQVKVAKI